MKTFDSKRIQIIGLTEMSYLDELTTTLRNTHLEKLFSFQPPAVVLSRGMQPLSEMMQYGKKYGVPILMSTEMTSALMGQLITTLNTELAPRITRHGVLVEVYGEGILILGDSGVGKSETAIELVKRGHRLIADDAVELRRVSYRKILGTAPANIRHFIELRGIGIINVARVFGIGSVRSSVEVEMVVQLEPWDRTKNYDRTGLETEYYDILGVKVPSMLIPVMPGRNLAVILETAAINNRQKEMGYNAAKELLTQLGLQDDIYKVEKRFFHSMQMIADLHTHTLCATHAYNTFDGDGRCRQGAGLLRPCRDRSRPRDARCTACLAFRKLERHAPHHRRCGDPLRRRGQCHGYQGRAGPVAEPAQSAGLGRGVHPQCLCAGASDPQGGKSSLAGCGRKPLCGLHRPFRAGKLPL